jgi:putative transcriptional regulator
MPLPDESPLSVAGSLLVASPSLLDPNFRRSVVFVSTNDADDGSFGFIINRATPKTVGDLLPGKDIGILGDVPVFIGGPVARDQLTFASFLWNEKKRAFVCKPHLALGEADEIAQSQPGAVRAFIGYAGWGQGQLETEMAQNAWILRKASRDTLDAKKLDGLWRRIVRGLGPVYRLLADVPDDPSRN